MDNSFFRELNEHEQAEFKQWANDNFVPNMDVSPVWHPVVRVELARLQTEFNATNEIVENHLDE